MRKLITSLAVLATVAVPAKADVMVDATTFPDERFRNWILSQSWGCDGVLTDQEIANVDEINVSYTAVRNLKGVEYFSSLRTLDCGACGYLTTLDVSRNTALEYLDCRCTKLTTLDVSQNTALKFLNCGEALVEKLSVLDVTNNTALETLYCYCNHLTELDLSQNTALKRLDCDNNQLTSLDISQNKALQELDCYENQLTSLDVTQNTALQILYCYNNELTSLDVSQNNTALIWLDCHNNELTTLDVSRATELYHLSCYNNQLTSLTLSSSTVLKELYCYNNQLTTLDVSQNKRLQYLRCYNNQLTSLDVSEVSDLKILLCYDNQLTSLCVSRENWQITRLECYNNYINAYYMNSLAESLPSVRNGASFVPMIFIENTEEHNVCTPTAVTTAVAKGWRVYAKTGEYESVEYNGSAPSDISTITAPIDDLSVPRYNLNGQRVGAGASGVIIHNGRKYIVR